jgi:hypothetical protein
MAVVESISGTLAPDKSTPSPTRTKMLVELLRRRRSRRVTELRQALGAGAAELDEAVGALRVNGWSLAPKQSLSIRVSKGGVR